MGSCNLCAWLTLLHTMRVSDWQSLYPSSQRVWECEQLLFSHSIMSESVTQWTVAHRTFLSFTISNSCPLNWWYCPTTSSSVTLSPPSLNLSWHQGLFQWVGSSHQVAKVLEFQLQHQSFQWIFRTDFLQHSSKASILQLSDFFMVHLSHPFMTTGNTIALTTWTFVGKVMSLLFNLLSRFIIVFLPGSQCL